MLSFAQGFVVLRPLNEKQKKLQPLCSLRLCGEHVSFLLLMPERLNYELIYIWEICHRGS